MCRALFGLAVVSLLAAGCLDIEAPLCDRVEDCDRDAGYLFCKQGYCFRSPDPGGADLAPAPFDASDVADPDVGGGDAAPDPARCVPGDDTPAGPADGCCPAWGGHALGGDPDCAGSEAALPAVGAPWVALLADGTGLAATALDGGAPARVVAAVLALDGTPRSTTVVGVAARAVPPIALDGGVLVARDGYLEVLAPESGAVRARAALDVAVAPARIDGARIAVVTAEGVPRLLTAALVDEGALATMAHGVTQAAPVVGKAHGARLYVLDDAGTIAAFVLDGSAVAPVWQLPVGLPAAHALAVDGARVVVLTASDGVVVLEDGGGAGRVVGSALLGGGLAPGVLVDAEHRVLVVTAAGEVAALALRDGTLEVVARADAGLSAAGAAPLLLADGTVVLGGEGGLAGVRPGPAPAGGTILWRFVPPDGRAVRGVIHRLSDGTLLAPLDGGRLAMLPFGLAPLADAPWPTWRRGSDNGGAPAP